MGYMVSFAGVMYRTFERGRLIGRLHDAQEFFPSGDERSILQRIKHSHRLSMMSINSTSGLSMQDD